MKERIRASLSDNQTQEIILSSFHMWMIKPYTIYQFLVILLKSIQKMVLINRRKIVFNENIQIFFSSVSHICKHMISVEDYESRGLPDNNCNEAGELVSCVTFDTQKFNKDAANVGLVKPVNRDSLTPSPEKKTRTAACSMQSVSWMCGSRMWNM